jgi:ABC-2 type transport system permease protein
MRLWSEEQRLGTMELILTMPVAPWEVIVGKFLAACTLIVSALLLTLSLVITLFLLGKPDVGTIWSGYIGSFLVGASAVAITCAVSALTRSQVACLLISVMIIFGLVLAGFPPFQEFATNFTHAGWVGDLMGSMSLLYHLNLMAQGLLKLQTLVYFASVIGFCLFLTSVIIRSKRS